MRHLGVVLSLFEILRRKRERLDVLDKIIARAVAGDARAADPRLGQQIGLQRRRNEVGVQLSAPLARLGEREELVAADGDERLHRRRRRVDVGAGGGVEQVDLESVVGGEGVERRAAGLSKVRNERQSRVPIWQ